MQEPLEFEDGQAFLRKTDILAETMYFSYDKTSDADLYPLAASDVMEIIRMNRNGIKPESLKGEPEPAKREFIDAVGDDSISRFDSPKKRKKKNHGGKGQRPSGRGPRGNGGNGNGSGDSGKGGNKADASRPAPKSE